MAFLSLSDTYRLIREKAMPPDRDVCLIAVSKKQPIEKIEELYQLGHRDFGENYVQELVTKAETLRKLGCTEIRWHFIGHLQTNKVKLLAPWVCSVHSIDSEKLAAAVAKNAVNKPLPVFIEVNMGDETSKAGVALADIKPLAQAIAKMPELSLQGLMCIPPHGLPPSELRASFRMLQALESSLGDLSRRKLSMGMSADFEIAISEGATHVRVGTALFGARS